MSWWFWRGIQVTLHPPSRPRYKGEQLSFLSCISEEGSAAQGSSSYLSSCFSSHGCSTACSPFCLGCREIWPRVGIKPGCSPPPHHSLPCHVSVTLLCISWPMTREQQREAGGPRIGRRNPDGWGLTVTPSSLMFWRQHPGSASWQGLLDCKSCRLPAQCLTSPSLGLIFQFPFPNTNL